MVRIRDITAKSVPVSSGIIETCKGIRVYKTNEADVPIAVGLLNEVIIIPDRPYTEKDMQLIIRHEYTHIKNKDLLIQLLTNILCAIYWWNPAVYLFRRDLEQYFEIRCDKTVTADMSKKETAEYLDVLLKIYNAGQSGVSRNTVGVIENYKAGGKELKERFERLSESFERRSRQYMGRMAAVVITICLLAVSYILLANPFGFAGSDCHRAGGFEPITPYPAIALMLLYCGKNNETIKNCHSTGARMHRYL